VLGLPYIKFIYILSFLNKINKKILCFIVEKKFFIIKGVNQQETLLSNLLGFPTHPRPPRSPLSTLRERVHHSLQRVTLAYPTPSLFLYFFLSRERGWGRGSLRPGGLEGYNTSYSNSKGSSETTCDITYNFEEYSNLIPQQKKKINKNFLE